MQKWAYRLIKIDNPGNRDSDIEERLNAGGRLGYELAAVSVQFTTHFLWLKRPIPDSEP